MLAATAYREAVDGCNEGKSPRSVKRATGALKFLVFFVVNSPAHDK